MTDTPLAALVQSAETGDTTARAELCNTLYGELRRVAERQLRANA